MMLAAGPISLASAALGLIAVAALYALHHLRSQPVRRPIATLIFWREAVRPQTTRSLWASRPRHLWTFLLLSAIALLISAALSADRWSDRATASQAYILVVDVGSSMAREGANGKSLFRNAINAARSDADVLGVAMLITAGAQPSVVCRSDAPAAVLKDRLDRLALAATASGSTLALQLAGSELGTRDGTILWYTDRAALPIDLPQSIARRVEARHQVTAPDVVAIVGATFEPSTSSASRGNLRVRVAGRASRAMTLDATVGDRPLVSQKISIQAEETIAVINDLPTNGEIVSLSLRDAPGSPAEHLLRFTLPRRGPLKFNVVGSIPRSLRDVLEAIGSEVASAEGAIVVASDHRAIPTGALAMIEILDAAPASDPREPLALAATAPATLASIDFEGAGAAGVRSVPTTAMPILLAGDAVVAGIEGVGAGKRLFLSSDLVDADAELPRVAAFPVLMLDLVSRLADHTSAPPTVTSLRSIDDPLWRDGDSDVVTTVHDAPGDAMAYSDTGGVREITRRSRRWAWNELLLATALTLLVIEGLLLAGKKIV